MVAQGWRRLPGDGRAGPRRRRSTRPGASAHAHRRRRIDLPARRRHEALGAVVIRFEALALACMHDDFRLLPLLPSSSASRRIAARQRKPAGFTTRERDAGAARREPLQARRRRRARAERHASSTPTRSSSSPIRTAPSRRGNVVFTQGDNRIAADRADFNTQDPAGHLLRRQRHRQYAAAAAAAQPGGIRRRRR